MADKLIRGLSKREKVVEVQWINSNEMIDIMMSHAVERFLKIKQKIYDFHLIIYVTYGAKLYPFLKKFYLLKI